MIETAALLLEAAAEFQHAHARRQVQLARDRVELCALRVVQTGRLTPPRFRIGNWAPLKSMAPAILAPAISAGARHGLQAR